MIRAPANGPAMQPGSSSTLAGVPSGEPSSSAVRISIVLPVHNEEPNLRPLLQELDDVLRGMGVPYEILAIDDGSTDGSRRLLRSLCEEYSALRVLLFRHNSG